MSDVASVKPAESYGSIQIPTTAMVTLINGTYQSAVRAVQEATVQLSAINKLLVTAQDTTSHIAPEVSAAITEVTAHCIKRLELAASAMKIE